jgi:hypothetical protein
MSIRAAADQEQLLRRVGLGAGTKQQEPANDHQ